jgi:hypothetical protein
MERVNVSVLNEIEKGRKIIQDAGGVRAYDQRARGENQQ